MFCSLVALLVACSPKSADLTGRIPPSAPQTEVRPEPEVPTIEEPVGEPPPEPPKGERFSEIFKGKVDGQKVDILWVVDNSSSMETSQQRLADNFDAFIQQFEKQSFDFQMGVTTTDGYRGIFRRDASTSVLKSSGIRGSSGQSILTSATTPLKNLFMKNILQGDQGDSDERAFQSMREALNNPSNSQLLRSEAHLAVIVISDEDDISHDEGYWTESHYSNYLKDPNLHKIDVYKNDLERLKGSLAKVSFHAITIKDEACRQTLGGDGRKIGKRYLDLVAVLSGSSVDLCSEFGESLKFLSNGIIRKVANFLLSRKVSEPESIEVKMRGETVPSSSTEGWTYFAETQSLQFYGSWIPAHDEEVIVSYEIGP